ncbi:transposase, partial [Bacillus sp. J33]
GKSSLMIHDRHANLKYNHGSRTFWAKGYYVSTVGLNQKTVAKYIREQEAEDKLRDHMTKREYVDPFKDK